MSLLNNVSEWWQFIVGVVTTLGGAISWYAIRKRNADKADQMLLDRLEKFKKIIVLKTSKEVEQSTTIAEKDKIIQGLKVQCPECYDAYMKHVSP